MHLQNVVMQLRKVCSHPFLFDWPLDSQTHQPVVDEQLVDASGKMMVLERLLEALFERGHKVLVFSQFVTMLNAIEVMSVPLFRRARFVHEPTTAMIGLGTRVQELAIVSH
jgi:ATP-dependent DNA helicase